MPKKIKKIVKPVKKEAKKMQRSAKNVRKATKKIESVSHNIEHKIRKNILKEKQEEIRKEEKKIHLKEHKIHRIKHRKEGKKDDLFWADQLAEEVIKLAKKQSYPTANCAGGASPSGTKHIGNLFDATKPWIVYKALQKRKFPSRFIHYYNDVDPLRTIPTRIADLDANWIDSKKFGKDFLKYLGQPYTTVPDPLGCHDSWAEHFERVWENGMFATGIEQGETQIVHIGNLYKEGKFDPYIEKILKNITKTREIIRRFQKTIPDNYIPFHALCQNCGKITTHAVDFDLGNKTITYECRGRTLAGKYTIEGCGHRGTVSFREGKLPWRFEWPAQWAIMKESFEAFGKEHFEGSWQSGRVIARDLYDFEPPVAHVYEFILINGEKMASRRGNVFIAQEILEVIEPEIFMYFYTKRSLKQRNLDLNHIYHLVDEFEKAERIYFGLEQEPNEKERATIMRMYETSMRRIPMNPPIRIPYRFAAVVAQTTLNFDHALSVLQTTGHIRGKLSEEDREIINQRLNLARNWVERFSPKNKITLHEHLSPETKRKLSDVQKQALRDVAMFIGDKPTMNEEELNNKFYEIIKYHKMKPSDFFQGAYLVLLGKTSGPKLAQFVIAVGEPKVRRILEQI